MIIYRKSDTELVIPCGLGTVVCPDTDHSLQMKTIDSSTVLQDITPDAGYYGLYRVIVNPYELDSKTIDSSTEPQVITSSKDGLFEVIVNPYTLESKTQTITVNGEYSFTPDEADGLSRVDISVNVADTPAVLQSKTADASTETQVITPDEGYDGLSQVTVDPYTLESKSDTITENGVYAYYPSTADGLADVTIDVSIDTVNNQAKTVDSSTTIQYVQPDQGYTGLEYVAVNPYTLDSKTVNPSTGSQTVTSDEDGLSSVTVNPVTAAIDPDLVPGNIKKDVDILGVVGTFEGGTLQSKTVDSSTSSQTITPDGVNYGLSSVTVNPYTEEAVSDTITQNGQYTYTAQNADTLSEVTIDVSVADIPAVIQTKSVTYTQNGEYTVTKDAGYDGMSSVDISVNVPTPEPELQSKTVSSSTNSQTVTPDQNYDGLSSVTVNPYTLENKTVDSSTTQQTISADNGYDGLNMVTVNPYTLDSKTVDASTASQTVTSSEDGLSSVTVNAVTAEIDPNIKDYNIVEGVTILGVTGSRHIANLQLVKYADSSTSVVDVYPDQGYDGMRAVYVRPYHLSTDSSILTQNGQYVFEPSAGYNGLSQVTVDVSVHASVNLQSKIANPSTTLQYITPDQGYDGLSEVAVNPYQLQYKILNRYSHSSSSNTVTPEEGYNGLSYVTVYWPGLMDITLDASTVAQVITPASRSTDYFNNITVNPYTTEADSSVLTQNGTYTFTPQNADALSQVTIDVSVDGQQINNQNKTVDSSTVSQSITADQGYTGLGTVTVNPYTTETDSSVLTQNGTYTFTPANADALSSVTIDVSVDTSSGVNDWIIETKKGNITDLSTYSISDVVGKNYGATGFFAGTSIISLPQMNDTSIGHYSLEYAFRDTSCLDVSVSMPGITNVGGAGMHECFYYSAIRSFEMPDVVSIEGQGMMYCFAHCNNLTSVSFPELVSTSPSTGTYRQSALYHAFYLCSNLTTASFPKLQKIYDNDMYLAFEGCNSLVNLEVHPAALSYSTQEENMTRWMTNLANLTLTQDAVHTISNVSVGYDIHLDWSSHLTADSVLEVITHLPTNLLPGNYGTVTFYTNGLTVTDYSDGRIQTAYNAATTAGWTILNLTINQPAPPVPSVTLLEYITAGDSHTEDNKIQLPCNVTNSTVIQFTVNWRDDQGGAFIATAARDFDQNEWRTFGYNNCLYSDIGGGTGSGSRFYVAETWSAVYHQYGTIEIGVDSSYHIYQKDVSTGITYTNTDTTGFRSIGSDHISYIGSDYTWLREIKVYENGINGGLTYDFVAAKDQNDVPGLYDTVSGLMYYATTGSMIAGPVLS